LLCGGKDINQKMKKHMVVENYKEGCFENIYERYNSEGRLLPEGLNFSNSWVNKEKNICFQLMEANDPELFYVWFEKWNDLVDFELYPID
jgi:hypothetical protein